MPIGCAGDITIGSFNGNDEVGCHQIVGSDPAIFCELECNIEENFEYLFNIIFSRHSSSSQLSSTKNRVAHEVEADFLFTLIYIKNLFSTNITIYKCATISVPTNTRLTSDSSIAKL